MRSCDFVSYPSSRRLGVALLAALVLTLPGGASLAGVSARTAGGDASDGIQGMQGGVAWMGGGVGEDARDSMRRAASAYNVRVVFSERQGAYLADVPFTGSLGDGKQLLSGSARGPCST